MTYATELMVREMSKEISYFYTKYIPLGSEGNNYHYATIPITAQERRKLDSSRGNNTLILSESRVFQVGNCDEFVGYMSDAGINNHFIILADWIDPTRQGFHLLCD